MKFSCLQENLEQGLGIVSKAISASTPLPILANVLIETKDGRLKLTTSNTETSISCYVGASIEKDGAITVPANLFKEFISNLNTPQVEGELEESRLNLSAGKNKSKLHGIAASSYPELPSVPEDADVIKLDPQIFSTAVSLVAFSSAIDDSRPVLSGILLKYEDGNLTLVSADGFRLSEKVIKVDSELDPFKIVVPAKTLIEVARIFSKTTEPIKFLISENNNMALFESNDIYVYTRILEGQFPDYEKLIPDDHEIKAEFSAQDLLEAVKLNNVFAKRRQDIHSPITVVFDPQGKVKVNSISQETGQNDSEFECIVEMGGKKEVEMVFNSGFLLDVLTNLKSDKLVFSSKGSLTPGVIKSAENEDYIHLIMPIRNQD